ncbi:MAG: archaellin/type IV pilin N-terminal domain-containing protein, partial [Acidilobaceae archaeon]
MKAKRGISPIIATVILIAVTIAIGIAIAGWLMGLWGGMGGAESLKIYPNATLTNNELKLTVKNEGSRDAKIIEVRVDGVGRCTFNEFVKTGEMKTLSCQPGTAA